MGPGNMHKTSSNTAALIARVLPVLIPAQDSVPGC